MVVYWDVLLLIQLVCNLHLLWLTAYFRGHHGHRIRFAAAVLAGCAGGMVCSVLYLGETGIGSLFAGATLWSVLVLRIAFEYRGLHALAGDFLMYLFWTILTGGALMAGPLHRKDSLLYVICGFLVLGAVLWRWRKRLFREKNVRGKIVDATFYFGTQKVCARAIWDTGNCLYSPYSREPVHVISTNLLEHATQGRQYLLIPCQTVSGDSLLKVFRFDVLFLGDEIVARHGLVAASDHGLQGKEVQCVIHSDLRKGMREYD